MKRDSKVVGSGVRGLNYLLLLGQLQLAFQSSSNNNNAFC